MTITITLRGDPGIRTGTIQIGASTWQLATWHKQAGGEVHATTDDGKRVTLATHAGNGGITIGADWWALSDCKWAGLVMTGVATPGESTAQTLRVSDAEMARMFPDAGWE